MVKYVYDRALPIIERDAAGTSLTTYTRIPGAPGGIGGLISSSDVSSTIYYHCSHLGNVEQITDSAGAVIQTYEYDAFGNIVNESGSLNNDHQYKTKEYSPNTGLIYFGARYYNPVIGRFITPDPLGMVDGPNMYLYCGNDPVNSVDPYGKYILAPVVKIIVAALLAAILTANELLRYSNQCQLNPEVPGPAQKPYKLSPPQWRFSPIRH
ncbi:MAG: RHS repeat-associated core domain-containing protein [Candidatus Omnitrophota bacterium]